MYRNDQSHEFANRESLVDQEAENERNVGCGEVGGGGDCRGGTECSATCRKNIQKMDENLSSQPRGVEGT